MKEADTPGFSDELVEDTGRAIYKLIEYTDDQIDPSVVDFAHYLGQRLRLGEIAPEGFVHEAIISAIELMQGRDALGRPITHRLAMRELELYDDLLQATPDIAQQVFNLEFAKVVETEIEKTPLFSSES